MVSVSHFTISFLARSELRDPYNAPELLIIVAPRGGAYYEICVRGVAPKLCV